MHYRIYAKFEGQKKFEALDLSTGGQVKNLIYASLITESKFQRFRKLLKTIRMCNLK